MKVFIYFLHIALWDVMYFSNNRPSGDRNPSNRHCSQHVPGCQVEVPGWGWPTQHDLCVAKTRRRHSPHWVSSVLKLSTFLLRFTETGSLCTIHLCVCFRSLKSRVKIIVDGTLLISRLTPADSGNYTCMPTNGLHVSPSASAILTVQRKCFTYHAAKWE